MSQNEIDIDSFVNALLADSVDSNMQLPDPTLAQYYQDLANRVIWIDGEINGSTLDVISKIIFWNREDKNIPIQERKPIRLFFMSVGGELDVEEAIVSIIKLSKTPVYGIAIGVVASAASLIYLSCHRRFALTNAYFIFHRGSMSGLEGNYNEIQAAMEDYRAQIEKMEKFYIENTSYPEEIVKEKIKTDWYIHIEEAMKYGVVTDLIEDIDILL